MKATNRTKFAMMMALTASGLFSDAVGGLNSNTLCNGVTRAHHPWDKIQLTKSERRGKTYEELQAMRKERWEANR